MLLFQISSGGGRQFLADRRHACLPAYFGLAETDPQLRVWTDLRHVIGFRGPVLVLVLDCLGHGLDRKQPLRLRALHPRVRAWLMLQRVMGGWLFLMQKPRRPKL